MSAPLNFPVTFTAASKAVSIEAPRKSITLPDAKQVEYNLAGYIMMCHAYKAEDFEVAQNWFQTEIGRTVSLLASKNNQLIRISTVLDQLRSNIIASKSELAELEKHLKVAQQQIQKINA